MTKGRRAIKFCIDGGYPSLQLQKLLLEAWRAQAFSDGVVEAFQLALDGFLLRLEPLVFVSTFRALRIARLCHLPDETCHRFGLHQPGLEKVEDDALKE